MTLPFVIGTPLVILIIGIALEIATFLSGRNNNSGMCYDRFMVSFYHLRVLD